MFNPDLVKTLRICERDQAVDQLMNDAADEIERLRAENAKLRRLNPDLTGYANGYADAMEDAPDPVFSDADAAFMVEMGRKEIDKLRTEVIEEQAKYDTLETEYALLKVRCDDHTDKIKLLVKDKARLRHVLSNLIGFAETELPEPMQYAVREAFTAWAQTSDNEPPDFFGAKKIARDIIKSQSTSRTEKEEPSQSPTLSETIKNLLSECAPGEQKANMQHARNLLNLAIEDHINAEMGRPSTLFQDEIS